MRKQLHMIKSSSANNIHVWMYKTARIKLRTLALLIKSINATSLTSVYRLLRYGVSADIQYKLLGLTKLYKPSVSIIIPTYNKPDLLIDAINSIVDSKPKQNFEIVVVDNGSNEILGSFLNNVSIVNYLPQKENLGFVGGCNKGAEHAKGSILVFLNDDTIVQNNWLDSLIETLSDETIGIVGSKLIYPDGSLQEAGGIIFNDATGNNYGKYQDALDFSYNYLCDVDYVSGASIAISKKLFTKLGMFDVLYAPAYYEDTDLCFSVRKAGKRVVYQPQSVAIHIEGATSGTDLNTGFKKYQMINKDKFKKKWDKELKQHYSPSQNIFKARTRFYKDNILFIDSSVPEPNRDSGSVRQYKVLKLLIELGYHVTFWPKNMVASPGYTSQLQQMGVEVAYGLYDFEDFMRERENIYGYVFLSRPYVATFLGTVTQYQPSAKTVYDTVDLHFLRLQRKYADEKDEKYHKLAEYFEVFEKDLMKLTNTTLCVSEAEIRLLKDQGVDANIVCLSNIHDIDKNAYSIPYSKRKDLVFVGSYGHKPNQGAVEWLVKDIFPKIRKQNPKIELHIVGSGWPEELMNKYAKLPGVVTEGFVEDLGLLLRSCRVFVAPIKYGAGVKGKIGQAIEYGIPVVSTPTGIEGMHLMPNESCLEASNVEEFAQDVISLYSDNKLWSKIQTSAKKVLQDNFSTDKARQTLEQILR